MNVTWIGIATIVLGSSVLSAIFTNIWTSFAKRREANRHNSLLALLLAHRLEDYAHRCARAVDDDETFRESAGSAGKEIGYPPEPFELPDETLREFDLTLLDQVLDFPQRISFARDAVDFWGSVGDSQDASAAARGGTASLAKAALQLANEIRTRYRLKQRSLKFGVYDLRKRIDELATKYKEED